MGLRTGRAGLLVITAALLVLPACSDDAKSGDPAPAAGQPTSTTSAQDEPTSTSVGDGGTRVAVTEREYSITLSRNDFTPGTYTFVVDNDGESGHDVAITGPGVEVVKRLPPGTQAEIVVNLQSGRYELWCSIDDHSARGMKQSVTVAG
jgi:uncharacterized cupredoxin-like copper-binding protein